MIIHVPHPTLRMVARPIEEMDEKTHHYITDMETALRNQRNPRGVGLSFPQIDHSLRAFSTFLSRNDDDDDQPSMRTFINPHVVETSQSKTFGPDLEHPILEGCLSIPHLYGPVPRYEWVRYAFQTIQNESLIEVEETFRGFAARVMQHEFDHLEGILFTDYTLQFDLPLYDDQHGKMKLLTNKEFLKKY